MVPLTEQGHLNQLLHLSRLISAYNIPVHYVGSTTHNRKVKFHVHGWDPLSVENFHFHEFQIPDFQSLPANPNASKKFPSHIQPAFDATSHLRRPVASILNSLSPTAHRVKEWEKKSTRNLKLASGIPSLSLNKWSRFEGTSAS
ncbi:putative zeatin O-glucosyltransferase-like [Abeliophyllum distichum]|uniref:Zeatin O-glucosyltransferase-like n=1 Tax=Abeliophyllum distichum TaxID=126358 RepID=A0ABD1SE36_9LAMI